MKCHPPSPNLASLTREPSLLYSFLFPPAPHTPPLISQMEGKCRRSQVVFVFLSAPTLPVKLSRAEHCYSSLGDFQISLRERLVVVCHL